MRRIVHLSDLHFGWSESQFIHNLSSVVAGLQPDLTVISGDFVEHATVAEFQQARAFVQALPKPILTVPGNHDLPFYNLPRRIAQRLRLYREYVEPNMTPFFLDSEIAVLGIDTARVWPIRGGSIDKDQIAEIDARLCHLPKSITRVLVTHHPFDLPNQFPEKYLLKNGQRALNRVASCLDLLLAGHMHIGASGRVADRFQTPNGSLVFSQAGTAISKRYKGERNSFNLIEVERPLIKVLKYTWDADKSLYESLPGTAAEFTMD